MNPSHLSFPTNTHDPSTEQLTQRLQQSLSLSIDQPSSTTAPQAHDPLQQPTVAYHPSQHYIHSAHAAPGLHPLQPLAQDQATRLLIQNDIAPSSLSQAQFSLLQRSTLDEQARLILLWRLAPPKKRARAADGMVGADGATLEGEEGRAWARYRSAMQGKVAIER